MSLKPSKILTTGGNGFIGKHLFEYLVQKGIHVDNFDIADGNDVKDRDKIFQVTKDYKIIYHLARVLGTHELNKQAYEASMENIIGTMNYPAAKLRGIKNKFLSHSIVTAQ